MLTEASLRDPVLINTVGHTAGMLLFGFIIALLVRDRRTHENRKAAPSILAASLAFSWNVGSLVALGSSEPDSFSMQIIMTASFAVLSLLPAVLLQIALRQRQPVITKIGYALSVAAILLHLCDLFVTSSAPHQIALLVLAIGFASLTLIALIRVKEWFSLGCLLLFVVSFPHFGYQHFHSPWSAEITWHHIGIPVALVVLLQDYRFLLLDTFIRFLMNSALAAAYVASVLFVTQRFHLFKLVTSNVFLAGIALVAVCLSLILFAHVRNELQRWIGRTIFHRKNLDDRIRAINQLPAVTRSEEDLIDAAAQEVAAYFRSLDFAVVTELATRSSRHELLQPVPLPHSPASSADVTLLEPPVAVHPWAEAQIPLRFSSGEVRYLLTGARRGRQRYLSEDLEDMRRLASVIVERVERFRSEELRRLADQAELRALQAQINPHFLFNAFNTLYGTIDRASVDARRLVLNLTEIFRYFLQGDRSLIPLSEELRIVRAYLEIEKLRLGDRLQTELDVGESALGVMIPILSLQPLVENAVKHGVAARTSPGRVAVHAHKQDGVLTMSVEDASLAPASPASGTHDGFGLGLTNVRRRLNLSFGPDARLDVAFHPRGCTSTVVIPLAHGVRVAS